MPKLILTANDSGTPIGPFSMGTKAQGIIYTSGILPFDRENKVVHIGDAEAQTRYILDTIRSIVEVGGGIMEDITFNCVFLSDWKYYKSVNKAYAEYFPGDKPARFCIQCGLVSPDALVEISSIAHTKT